MLVLITCAILSLLLARLARRMVELEGEMDTDVSRLTPISGRPVGNFINFLAYALAPGVLYREFACQQINLLTDYGQSTYKKMKANAYFSTPYFSTPYFQVPQL
jgi:hypothetical protein